MFVTLYAVYRDNDGGQDDFPIYVNPNRISAVKGSDCTSRGDASSFVYGDEVDEIGGQEFIYQASTIYLDSGESLIIDMPPDEVVEKLNEELKRKRS